jgi:(1->4)-alpha-D-glucan 1-alpha-D-glucosylmutase
MIPRATLRLQFHKGFAFANAEQYVDYFTRLGISHIYASPITTARAGSPHGYDVIDPTRVNSELGGEAALRRLMAALRARGLGLIVDIVPNHMAVGAENPWWVDVLRHGRASRYAAYFDIDWESEDETLRGKVLLPILGRPLQETLAANEIALASGPDGPELRYFDHRVPVSGEIDPSEPLPAVLSRQPYRLAWWRVANDEINWRRFFDINELAGLRMEHPPCFEDVHALIFRLYAEGLIDGVRVDHIDGLSDPARYCVALRERLTRLSAQRPSDAPAGAPYIIVEKILLRGETLPRDWACDGTSGYDFMNDVSAVQHDPRGEAALTALWVSVSGRDASFEAEERAARREIIARSFAAQLEACAAAFHRLARAHGAELSRASLRRALTELLAHFPIYRTYATASERPEHDAPFRQAALRAAHTSCLPQDRLALDRLGAWLSQLGGDPASNALLDRAVMLFQQLSAPVAAKAVEDTAFYRYGRLLSRNDVGFEPTLFSTTVMDFHRRVLRRQADTPHAMLATATHDHKRGEDVRARLAASSEFSQDWARAVPRWIAQCEPLRTLLDEVRAPHARDIAMLLQMIVGAWPLDLILADDAARRAFGDRLARWQDKALREAKLATEWTVPNESYGAAARALLTALVNERAVPELLSDIIGFAQRLAPAGAVNGLAQTLLKLTAPGVPDIYQGTELWDFSLVDPDNRRPVDFAARAAGLDDTPLEELATHWRDGRVKQALIARTLALRQERSDLFRQGSYEPISVQGAHAERVIAFVRRCGRDVALVVVPRLASPLLRHNEILFEPQHWTDTAISLAERQSLMHIFTGERIETQPPIRLSTLLDRFPCALLISSS